jgi:phospholipid transport system transporter-binding protein
VNKRVSEAASVETTEDGRARVVGSLGFSTVTTLLPAGSDAIRRGQAAVIDLAGVTDSDSAGLALLIEWLSVAHGTGQGLRYDNVPSQLHQLARLSEVEELIAVG